MQIEITILKKLLTEKTITTKENITPTYILMQWYYKFVYFPLVATIPEITEDTWFTGTKKTVDREMRRSSNNGNGVIFFDIDQCSGQVNSTKNAEEEINFKVKIIIRWLFTSNCFTEHANRNVIYYRGSVIRLLLCGSITTNNRPHIALTNDKIEDLLDTMMFCMVIVLYYLFILL